MTIATDVKLIKPEVHKISFKQTEPGAPKRLTTLVYGTPGAGKTYFCGTFPKPLFIDCNGGLMTVRAKQVHYVAPETYAELLTVLSSDLSEFETVILDTSTEAARIALESALALSGRQLPQLSDWALAIERLRRLVRQFMDLPQHIVWTAEEKTTRDEDTGRLFAGPSLPGQLSAEIGAFFDCVFHLRSVFNPGSGKRERRLLTEPDGIYYAKDRTGKLEKFEVPDFPTLWAKISKP